MRSQPRVDAFAEPKQFFAQFSELGAAALLLSDKGLAHSFGPSRDQSPRLAIGHADLFGRFGQLAGILDRIQEGKKLGIDRLPRLVPGLPDQIEVECRPRMRHMRISAY